VGVTAIDTSAAPVAVSTVDPCIEPDVAVIVVVPLDATTVATPPVVIVATPGVPDDHVTDAVRFCVLVSV
jgi:hypothetical protein